MVCQAGASIAACRSSPPTQVRAAGSTAATGPAGRRPGCRRPAPARRRAAPASATAWSAAAGRAPAMDGSPSSSQNICARVPRQKPSSGMVGELCSQPPDGVAETSVAPAVDHVDVAGVAAGRAVARRRSARRSPAAPPTSGRTRSGTAAATGGAPAGRAGPQLADGRGRRSAPAARARTPARAGRPAARPGRRRTRPRGRRTPAWPLDDPVDQRRRCRAAGRSAVAEHRQRLQQHRPLAPAARPSRRSARASPG